MVEVAFEHVGLAVDDDLVIDPTLFFPAEVNFLLGNPSKAMQTLRRSAWTTLEDMIREMVDADLKRCRRG